MSITKKCQIVVKYLQRLKLNDSIVIHFIFAIKNNSRNDFSDHSQLLDHLRNELLPICGSSRGYKFEICPFSDPISQTNLFAQILQIPRIDFCSNVEIKLNEFTSYQMNFPIELISNWLHRNRTDRIEEKPTERVLQLCSSGSNFPFARELCDHLTKVHSNFSTF